MFFLLFCKSIHTFNRKLNLYSFSKVCFAFDIEIIIPISTSHEPS